MKYILIFVNELNFEIPSSLYSIMNAKNNINNNFSVKNNTNNNNEIPSTSTTTNEIETQY